jgi:putative MATE family efflux protein
LSAPADATPAVFTRGSIMRHVLVMTGAGSVGLMAVFFVDLLSLLYISRLGDPDLTAAIGYASQIIFFSISINIGLIIAVGALVSRALGAGDVARARGLAASYLTHVFIASLIFTVAVLPERHAALELFGARGRALEVGGIYLAFTLPATVLLGLGMALAAVLRAAGDARRSMYVTLAGGIATAILDPIFIFGFGLGIYGAAIVTLISRTVFVIVGFHGAVVKHDLIGRPTLPALWVDLPAMLTIAIPAILTNLAAPVANAYAMRIFSQFGTPTVAAFAIIDRVTPVAFGALFALSSSVGPIMGQNMGAKLPARVRGTLTDCLIVAAAYTIFVWLVLWQATPLVVWVFHAAPETARVVDFFCAFGGGLWLFLGGIFVANAAFNNLGFPVLSTVFNWGRATLGTIPFVTYGAARSGPEGGILGMTAGAALFGVAAIATAYIVTGRLARRMTVA